MGERRIKTMKFCMKCGHQLPDEALFCTNCGAKQPIPVEEPTKEEPKVVEEQPKAESAPEQESQSTPKKDDFKLRDSVILLVGFVVIYIVWLILNKFVLGTEMLPRLGFFFANLGYLAISIIRMVKSIIRKNQFSIILHIVGVVIVGAGAIGQIIIMSQL